MPGRINKEIVKMKPAFLLLFLMFLWFVPGHGQWQTAPIGHESTDAAFYDQRGDNMLVDTMPIYTGKMLHPLRWESVKQDETITFLLHAHRNAMMDRLGVPGYRVHLFMDSGNRARLNTQKEQAAFEEKYTEQRSYIVYEEPYFKLRAGDFRTRLDARRFLEKIRRDYPAAYIVVDWINYPDLD